LCAVQSSTSKKFPAGAVVGICIAAVVVLLAIAIFLFLWIRRRQQQLYKPDHDYFNCNFKEDLLNPIEL
jgi:hypothetical protein